MTAFTPSFYLILIQSNVKGENTVSIILTIVQLLLGPTVWQMQQPHLVKLPYIGITCCTPISDGQINIDCIICQGRAQHRIIGGVCYQGRIDLR